jgi:histone H3/H4
MITKKQIIGFLKEKNKKISKEAIEELKRMLDIFTKDILKKATINADFKGRKIIKKEDIQN